MLLTEDRITGQTISVRAIDMATSNGGVDDGFPTSVLRQIAQSNNLNHPNVVKFDQIYQKNSKLILERPHMKWDLREFIRCQKTEYTVRDEALKAQRNYKPIQGLDLNVLKTLLR